MLILSCILLFLSLALYQGNTGHIKWIGCVLSLIFWKCLWSNVSICCFKICERIYMSNHLEIFPEPRLLTFHVLNYWAFLCFTKCLALSSPNSLLKRLVLEIMGFNTLCNITELLFLFPMFLEWIVLLMCLYMYYLISYIIW